MRLGLRFWDTHVPLAVLLQLNTPVDLIEVDVARMGKESWRQDGCSDMEFSNATGIVHGTE